MVVLVGPDDLRLLESLHDIECDAQVHVHVRQSDQQELAHVHLILQILYQLQLGWCCNLK